MEAKKLSSTPMRTMVFETQNVTCLPVSLWMLQEIHREFGIYISRKSDIKETRKFLKDAVQKHEQNKELCYMVKLIHSNESIALISFRRNKNENRLEYKAVFTKQFARWYRLMKEIQLIIDKCGELFMAA